MNDLQMSLYEVCQSPRMFGLELGDTVTPDDIPALTTALRAGLGGYGWNEPEIEIELQDVWKYYQGDQLIEDETGCAIVNVTHGKMTASTVLQWFVAVDTDNDGL